MRIDKISHTEHFGSVTLSREELILIANAVYSKFIKDVKEPKETVSKLYSSIIIARDLVDYGGLDSFSIESLAKLHGLIEREEDGSEN